MENLYHSILSEDYNNFICLFMVLPLQLLGNSYIVFALTIQILFNLPAMLIISMAGQRMLDKLQIKTPWLLCYSLASLCPTIFFPSANGYPDSLALIFVAILLLLAVDFNWKMPQRAHVVMMGTVLPLCMITRRYFSFYIINFALMLTIYGIVEVFGIVKWRRKHGGKFAGTLLRSIMAYAVVGFLSLGILLIFFQPMFLKALNNNYRVAYSAFSSGKLNQQFGGIYKANGGLIVLIALAGVVIGVLQKKTRGFSLGLAIGTLVSCLFFFHIQDMGPQHQLIVSDSFILFMIVCIGYLAERIQLKPCRRTMMIVIEGLLVVNFGIGWLGITVPVNPMGLFTTNKLLPKQRNDFVELHNLVEYINRQEGQAYLLSCGTLLNTDTLRYLDYPYKAAAAEKQCGTYDIDLRDGFPHAFFDCDIVIVPEPQQLMHGAENQRIIGALAQHFIDGTGFAVHYERLESFQLDGGITATVYRRFEDWTQEDYDALRAEFEGYYPDYPELFADRIHP